MWPPGGLLLDRSSTATLKAVGAPQGADPKESKMPETEPWHARDKYYRWSGDRHRIFFLMMALRSLRTGKKDPLPLLDIYRDLEEELERFLESDPRDGTKRPKKYQPSAPQARVGADNVDGYCVCCSHEPDD